MNARRKTSIRQTRPAWSDEWSRVKVRIRGCGVSASRIPSAHWSTLVWQCQRRLEVKPGKACITGMVTSSASEVKALSQPLAAMEAISDDPSKSHRWRRRVLLRGCPDRCQSEPSRFECLMVAPRLWTPWLTKPPRKQSGAWVQRKDACLMYRKLRNCLSSGIDARCRFLAISGVPDGGTCRSRSASRSVLPVPNRQDTREPLFVSNRVAVDATDSGPKLSPGRLAGGCRNLMSPARSPRQHLLHSPLLQGNSTCIHMASLVLRPRCAARQLPRRPERTMFTGRQMPCLSVVPSAI